MEEAGGGGGGGRRRRRREEEEEERMRTGVRNQKQELTQRCGAERPIFVLPNKCSKGYI